MLSASPLPPMTPTIAHRAAMEAVEVVSRRVVSPVGRICAMVTMMRIKVLVYMAIETTRTVKPRSSSNEDAISKPFRTIVAIRSAAVWRVVIVPVWAHGSGTDTYPE